MWFIIVGWCQPPSLLPILKLGRKCFSAFCLGLVFVEVPLAVALVKRHSDPKGLRPILTPAHLDAMIWDHLSLFSQLVQMFHDLFRVTLPQVVRLCVDGSAVVYVAEVTSVAKVLSPTIFCSLFTIMDWCQSIVYIGFCDYGYSG